MSQPQPIPVPGRDGVFIDPRTLSTTPGGTLYGTTPGGTKIIYDRSVLLHLRNSPLAKTPPSSTLPVIPGVTAPLDSAHHPHTFAQAPKIEVSTHAKGEEEDVFHME